MCENSYSIYSIRMCEEGYLIGHHSTMTMTSHTTLTCRPPATSRCYRRLKRRKKDNTKKYIFIYNRTRRRNAATHINVNFTTNTRFELIALYTHTYTNTFSLNNSFIIVSFIMYILTLSNYLRNHHLSSRI